MLLGFAEQSEIHHWSIKASLKACCHERTASWLLFLLFFDYSIQTFFLMGTILTLLIYIAEKVTAGVGMPLGPDCRDQKMLCHPSYHLAWLMELITMFCLAQVSSAQRLQTPPAGLSPCSLEGHNDCTQAGCRSPGWHRNSTACAWAARTCPARGQVCRASPNQVQVFSRCLTSSEVSTSQATVWWRRPVKGAPDTDCCQRAVLCWLNPDTQRNRLRSLCHL